MFNIKSLDATCRLWLTCYGISIALLLGWLLFEKMPDGREELVRSMENTFQQSKSLIWKRNKELLLDIQEVVSEDNYFSPQDQDYKSRVEKILALATTFEIHIEEYGAAERLCFLRDSFMSLVDQNEAHLEGARGISVANFMDERQSHYKVLIKTQLITQSQTLVSQAINYCWAKIGMQHGEFYKLHPAFLRNTIAPMVDEPFQAEVFLSEFWPSKISKCTTTFFLNDQPLSFRYGLAHILTTFPTPGRYTLHLRFRRERCRDGSITEVSRDFRVNVLERCDSVLTH